MAEKVKKTEWRKVAKVVASEIVDNDHTIQEVVGFGSLFRRGGIVTTESNINLALISDECLAMEAVVPRALVVAERKGKGLDFHFCHTTQEALRKGEGVDKVIKEEGKVLARRTWRPE